MALRGYRVYSIQRASSYQIIVESNNNDSFLYIENGCITLMDKDEGKRLGPMVKVADGCGLMGILRLATKSLSVETEDSAYLIVITDVKSVGKLNESDIYKIANVKFLSLTNEPTLITDERIPELARLLASESFYFSNRTSQGTLYDLTLSLQRRCEPKTIDNRFFWNRNLYFPLERFDINPDDWFVRCMVGSVIIRTIYVGHRTAKVAVISRLSCERVGTRFNVRGANDDGQVANFVETEQLISFENQESSFVQIRGSVPLIWEQPGIQVGSHSIRLRCVEASIPAFERHYIQLKKLYDNVTTVNLLGSKEGEKKLSEAFQTVFKTSVVAADTEMISYDYHAQMKISKSNIQSLQVKLDPFVEKFGFYQNTNGRADCHQSGVIRTNCLDCLDRTNCIQTVIAQKALSLQLEKLEVEKLKPMISSRFEETFKEIWQRNGDQCSIIYAGTGALEGKSKLKDASRSIARTLQNNLMDSSKQESFDLFLSGNGYYDDEYDKAACFFPVQLMRECPNALHEMLERRLEMCTRQKLSVFIGTWNVNGGKYLNNIAYGKKTDFIDWLWPNGAYSSPYDVVAVGLEEIVDLNASNMMKASTTNQRIFCQGVLKALLDRTQEKYVVLACEQLVGVCLILCVRVHLLPRIRGVSTSDVKTGMGGATGNKGSVAARLTIDATSICFVASHFAAGQNDVASRNDDFNTTFRKLRFSHGRSINSHDVVFWFGDFNYRVHTLPREEIKSFVKAGNIAAIVPYDQLLDERAAQRVFVGFKEGHLTFPPTYKYDMLSADYDTSDKARAPAWTDRVLWRDQKEENLVRQKDYHRSEVLSSDHRPVGSVFELDVLQVDLKKCEQVFCDVVSSLGPPDCMILCSLENTPQFPEELSEEVLTKMKQLDIKPALSLIDHDLFKIAFESGSHTLVALSMDGIDFNHNGVTKTLRVRLRSPAWESEWRERLAPAFQQESSVVSLKNLDGTLFANLILDDDDDDQMSLSSARSCSDFLPAVTKVDEILVRSSPPTSLPPPIPRPPPAIPQRPNGFPVVPPRPSPADWPPRFS